MAHDFISGYSDGRMLHTSRGSFSSEGPETDHRRQVLEQGFCARPAASDRLALNQSLPLGLITQSSAPYSASWGVRTPVIDLSDIPPRRWQEYVCPHVSFVSTDFDRANQHRSELVHILEHADVIHANDMGCSGCKRR